MSKPVYRVFAVALMVAICASPAIAESDESWPPPGFKKPGSSKSNGIGGLFGRSQKRKPKLFENWWDNDSSVVVYGDNRTKKGSKAVPNYDYDDPEPIPGLGMGNLPYVLPKLQAVRDGGLASLTAATLDATSIKLVLSDPVTPIKASTDIRDAVIGHYKATGFAPLWTANGRPTARAEELLAVFAAAAEEGLEPWRYLPASLSGFANPAEQIAGSSLAVAQFDVAMMVSALTYANHMSGGAFDPRKLSLYYDITPEAVDAAAALKVLAHTPYPKAYLAGLAPKHPAYAAMKAELAKLRTANTTETPFPSGKRVKTGQKDPRIPELRGRLIRLGHLDGTVPLPEGSNPEVLDKTIAKALKSFQVAAGIPQTSALDAATVKAFNADNTATNRDKLIINMERLRWLPKDLGTKHVFVNQASYEVRVMERGQPIWVSKVIVGRPTTQTNVFSDEMENVVFNPTWGMPQSILINEYLGKLRRDPGYFDRIGYQVVNAKGKKVSSRSVNWGSVSANSGIGVVQPAGNSNALGYVKFLFPNSHSIYMHDTPNRELFAEQRRTFSHGCVRVENPREFAQVLLGISAEDVESRIAQGNTQNVKLTEKIPVHLTYFTAWPDNSGKIRYFSDVYERDKTLEGARSIVGRAYSKDSTVKIVEATAKVDDSASD